jgi:hypothetical protein
MGCASSVSDTAATDTSAAEMEPPSPVPVTRLPPLSVNFADDDIFQQSQDLSSRSRANGRPPLARAISASSNTSAASYPCSAPSTPRRTVVAAATHSPQRSPTPALDVAQIEAQLDAAMLLIAPRARSN